MKSAHLVHRLHLMIHLVLTVALTRLIRAARPGRDESPERGDVPGWVMITLMSAVLVAALLAVAGPALENMFNDAINRVNP